MYRSDSECCDWDTPERHVDQVYERFLDRLDDLVRSYWLMKTLNLRMFPEALHRRHRLRLAHATELLAALREIGRLHPDLLAPRTAQFLNTLLPSRPLNAWP
jgi:hypothetical protein